MGKPVERQNHSLSFFILSTLIAICTAWAFYSEFVERRPWKGYQTRIFEFEREKARHDLRYYERKLESGELKVVLDPDKPDQTITVAEAKKRLAELEEKLARERNDIESLRQEVYWADIHAKEADLSVKLARSEDDGLFYLIQHAQHEEAVHRDTARKLKAEGKESEAAAAEKEAERFARELKEHLEERHKLMERIAALEKEAQKKAQALEEAKKKLDGKLSERDRLAAAIEAAEEPVKTARSQLEAALKKSPELTQYWLTTQAAPFVHHEATVDRCQNCHAAIDRCGFSRPYELLAKLEAPNARPEEVHQQFCVTPETAAHYEEIASAVCSLEWDEAASEKGEIAAGSGVCITDSADRKRIAEFLVNHCGPQNEGALLAKNEKLLGACLTTNAWAELAAYVEDPTRKTSPDRKTTWSVCDLKVADSGQSCLEGAAKDQMRTYVERYCNETSALLKALQTQQKVCAAGEDEKRLAQVKPVLFDLPVWAQTHPHRLELLTTHHPPEKFGCTTCHEGQGAQTKGVAGAEFKHGYDDPYWERPMLDLVAHKKYRPKSFSPPTAKEGVPGEWVTHQDQFVEATCAKCHPDEISLKYADTYSKGRKLVAELGCHGCHPIDTFADYPKVGPTLTDLKQKTTPAWLSTWLSYPKAFRPRTKMPNFWPEALNADFTVRSGSPEEQLRKDEVQKIAAFLWKSSDPDELPAPPLQGSAERGRVLAQTVGCRACHTFGPPDKLCTPEQMAQGKSRGTVQEPAECESPRPIAGSAARDFAPNLSNIGLKTNEKWLYWWLKNPSKLWKGTRMPNLRLTDQEAADIAAYLMTLKEGSVGEAPAVFANEGSPEFEKAAEEGSKLVTKYGCAGCHDIKGHENDAKIGADLNEYGRKTVDLLDFGNAVPNPRHHSWFNFVDLKLRAPRVYRYERVDTKMPQFDVTDEEVEAIMVFLKSRTTDRVPHAFLASKNERLTARAKGEQVIEYYNCKGCHVIDFEGGDIRDTYPEDQLANAPPILQQQGWRVQPEWFFDFLKDPSQRLRPWLDVRMPTFPLSDDNATAIVRGLSAKATLPPDGRPAPYPYVSLDSKVLQGKELEEAQALFNELRCLSCHTTGELLPGQDRSSAAPNLLLAKKRLRPDWVAAWLTNPQSLQEGTKMPSFFTGDDLSAVMYPNYFGGSQARQIEALRDYVMMLPDLQATPTAAAKPKKGAGVRGGSR